MDKIIITETLNNGKPAKATSDCGRYTWFWGQEDEIKDTVADRTIYQMSYMRREAFGSDPVPADVRLAVLIFWDQLAAAQSVEIAVAGNQDPDVGAAQPCKHCGSFCWGDCQAN